MCGRWAPAVACALALGCSEAGPDPRILSGPLRVDSEFDAEQREAVLAAVELWTHATHGRFAPELEFGPVECKDSFAIEAVHAPGCVVGQKVESADGRDGRVLGGTDPELHSIAVATWLDGSGFRDTVAHELGHYVLLGHGPGIMAQRRDRESSEVAAASVSEFCAIWGC
jgi:hypothetical protein